MNKDLNSQVIGAVKRLLKERKITQRHLAEVMKVTECEISLLMTGRRGWSLQRLYMLIQATGCQGSLNPHGFHFS